MGMIINHDYHIVELNQYGMTTKVMQWMLEKFGRQDQGRWFYRHPKIYFTNSQDHLMFVLRWS
jgi:hypothetical protein